jgi:hypothetical protein
MFSAKMRRLASRWKSWKQRLKRTRFMKMEAAFWKKKEIFFKNDGLFPRRTSVVGFQPSSLNY